jgi:hypothetical protein
MARCARRACGRWRPNALAHRARLGVAFDGRWFCGAKCLEIEAQYLLSEVRRQDAWLAPPALPVGRLLVQRQAVSTERLEAALHAQRHTGRRLGAELIAMGAVAPEHVVRALAAQAGVGCVLALDPARVADAPGGLAAETVQVLRVVPFEASAAQQRMAVACESPLPRSALAALREMTGWRMEPFVVPDALLDRLVLAYGTASSAPGAGHRPLRSLADAASRIAVAAERGLAHAMQSVRCESYIWVRLRGHGHAEDLMITLDAEREETSWQAAPTRH